MQKKEHVMVFGLNTQVDVLFSCIILLLLILAFFIVMILINTVLRD